MPEFAGPRLHLDQLLDEVIDSARDVQRTQSRLYGLIDAIDLVSRDLSLDDALRNIVDAARRLTTAAYGAVGLFGPEGRMDTIVQLGMSDEQVAAIGRLPEGHGLLGAVLSGQAPIRLSALREDSRSVGQPAGHVQMTSFLGVPIDVPGESHASLYLADAARGEFTREDEEIVSVLALAAGTALRHALLYEQTRVVQSWTAAAGQIAAQVIRSGRGALHLIADSLIELVQADISAIVVRPDDADTQPGRDLLLVDAASGFNAEHLLNRVFDLTGTVAARPLNDGPPLRIADLAEVEPELAGSVGVPVGPVLVVPLADDHGNRGLLAAARRAGGEPFTEGELAMAASFASQAGVALTLAGSRAREARLLVMEDRDRIAMDLHDHVIQELFAMGMELDALAGQLAADDPVGEQLRLRAGELDHVIGRLRNSIRALRVV